MNLAIDLGNTSVQDAFFENNTLRKHYHKITLEELEIIVQSQSIKHIVLSDVGKKSLPWINILQKYASVLVLDYQTPLPIENTYKTPRTLGNDRLAAVVGANFLYPNQNNLIADIGTCVTYDFIDENSVYHGGGIAPGLEMRLKSLPHFTAKLPLIEKSKHFNLIGQSTEESILSGTIGGFKREVESTIEAYKSRYPSLITIISGGDANQFDYLLKNSIFAAPDFLLTGLNHILEYNAKRL